MGQIPDDFSNYRDFIEEAEIEASGYTTCGNYGYHNLTRDEIQPVENTDNSEDENTTIRSENRAPSVKSWWRIFKFLQVRYSPRLLVSWRIFM